MQSKCIFVAPEVTNYEYNGVSRKIKSQIKSLKKYLQVVDYYLEEKDDVLILKRDGKYERRISNTKLKKIPTFTLYKVFNSVLRNESHINNIIYIRYQYCSIFLLILLFLLRKKNTLLIEIPTYPYDKEYKKRFNLYKEKFLRQFLVRCVDYIITYSEDKKIFGIPCINISNGIDLEETILKKDKTKELEDTLVFTFVGMIAPWHGVDRFLSSLENYYEKGGVRKIKFNIVGPIDNEILFLVSKSNNLKKIVNFSGAKSGNKLDEIYDSTDIAVGCLGNHRKGIHIVQALKNREYTAKGLPMIFSEDDPGLRGEEFVFRATPDENLIDINKVIEWYGNLKRTPEEIRKVAEKFTWDSQMKIILDKVVPSVSKKIEKD